MAPKTDHAIVIKIDSTDRSSLLLRDSLFVRSSVANGTDVAEFTLRDVSGSFAPADWDEVTIEVDGTAIFGGYIIQWQADSVGSGAAKKPVWQVSCKDWSVLLDRVLVNKQYKQTDDDDIVANLFATYLDGEGFDAATNVNNVRDDIDINLEEITLREALNSVAARANAAWHIAPDKSLYWYSPSTPAAAAFNISQTPNYSTTFNALEGTVRKNVDASQIINRVRVIGSESKSTALQVDSWAANGVDSVFGPLTKKPHTLWLVEYTVDLGGTPTNVAAYVSQIGVEPDDQLIGDGGTHTVLVNMENRTLTITDVGGLVPKNGTNVTVKYYYSTPIEITRNNSTSQTAFGRVFETSIYDENLSSRAEATAYGDKVLEEYAFGRETISFEVAKYGLLPGRLINVVNTTLGINGNYLITEVQFTATVVQDGDFLVVCSVQAGKATRTLIESLLPLYSAGAGRIPNPSEPNRITKIAANLGDVVAGRAMFTDGGTARFEWGTPNAATGVVVGLEDRDNNAYGALYIYESGNIRAKLGRMTGLPDVGSVTPTGWGLYTTNGYFQGEIVASTIRGGTIEGVALVGQVIEGAQITGGTVAGALLDGGTVQGGLLTGGTVVTSVGTIAGFTLEQNHMWSNGGTISTGSIVNSSNPGVLMSTAGLFGFGTLGMTFGIWTNPAQGPYFSSGTINNVVYEVYEAGVIRTNENIFEHGGIQMDSSGLFGVSPIDGLGRLLLESGDKILLEDGRGIALHGLKFMLDTVTGKLFAEDAFIEGKIYAREGYFSGTVEASQIVGGTITGVTIVGQVISGSDLVGGTITGIPIADAGITNGSLDSSLILGGTMTAAQIVGGTVTGGVFTGGTVTQGSISASRITGGTVSGALVSAGTVQGAVFSGGTVTQGSISASRITGGTVSGALVSAGTVQGAVFSGGTVTQGTISASRITGGTVSGALVSAGTVQGAVFSGGTVTQGTISASHITGGTVSGALVSAGTVQGAVFSGGTVTQGSISASHITGGTVTGGLISGGTVSGGVVSGGTVSGSYMDGGTLDGAVFTGGNITQGTVRAKFVYSGSILAASAQLGPTRTAELIPLVNNFYALGSADAAYNYLYLSDGTDEWRITVNSSGVLTTTKV